MNTNGLMTHCTGQRCPNPVQIPKVSWVGIPQATAPVSKLINIITWLTTSRRSAHRFLDSYWISWIPRGWWVTTSSVLECVNFTQYGSIWIDTVCAFIAFLHNHFGNMAGGSWIPASSTSADAAQHSWHVLLHEEGLVLAPTKTGGIRIYRQKTSKNKQSIETNWLLDNSSCLKPMVVKQYTWMND